MSSVAAASAALTVAEGRASKALARDCEQHFGLMEDLQTIKECITRVACTALVHIQNTFREYAFPRRFLKPNEEYENQHHNPS